MSLPILAGYVPIGVGFGLLWVQQGLPGWAAPLLALLVYAGAAQFLAAGMIAAGQGPMEVALAALVLNARHLVYGLAFLDRFHGWSAAKAYFAFALTDETYAVLSAHRPVRGGEDAEDGLLWRVALLNHGYWVLGCTLGAAAGHVLPPGLKGLDFALTALFLVLLLEQVRSRRKAVAAALAGSIAAIGVLLLGSGNTLLPILAVALAAVAAFGRGMGTGPMREVGP
ncbi:AzlC family ABC transporter permease [Oleisolibacter albus]|uniref:AzlC family ABC transporter permease n=1 Tax=Oleisolibacter albus TaxID=2171757 RepID=UPI00138FF2CA|nr:AzlC family ABC transporter permease [Oleisolibacter albus]